MKVTTRINQTELFFIVTQTIIGVAILSLPFQTQKTAAQDGWISVLLTGLAIPFFILLIWFLCKRFPHLTLFDFSKVILGKAFGSIINVLYIVYFLIIISYIFIMIDDILIRWILPETPRFVLLVTGIIVLMYGCMGNFKSMVHLFSFLFLFTLFLIVIVLLVLLESTFDIRYLLPVGSNGIGPILKGTKDAFPAFTGYETLLVYFAFIKQPDKLSSTKGSFIALLFITILYTCIVLLATGVFSPNEIKLIPEPVLYMLRAVDLHLLQRLDLIFLSVWGIVVAATILSYGYLGSMGMSKLLKVKHKYAVMIVSVIVLFLSITCHTFIDLIYFREWAQRLNLIFGIMIPTLLLFLAIIFKRKAQTTNEKE